MINDNESKAVVYVSPKFKELIDKSKREKRIEQNFSETTFGNIKSDPFIVHTSDSDWIAYPTHTHGLHNIGMPEFIMDPYCLGGKKNAMKIRRVYEYFTNPINVGQFNDILHGQVVKIPGAKLKHRYVKTDKKVYCFRKVAPSFLAVEMAYLMDNKDVNASLSQMKFIQIWIEGNDFALDENYYRYLFVSSLTYRSGPKGLKDEPRCVSFGYISPKGNILS